MYSMDNEQFCKRITLDLFPEENKKNSEMFICPFCHKLIFNPTSDQQGHLFCYNCISFYLEQNQNNHICPIGGEELNKNDITQFKLFNSIFSKTELKCPNENCKWVGIMESLPNHLKNECLKEKVSCPNKINGCEEYLPRDEFISHLKICKFREIKCPYNCDNKNIIINKLEEHYKICPNYTILCPQTCGLSLLRKDISKHINDICKESYVDCVFKDFGCQKKLKKNELQQHITKDKYEHTIMLASTVNKLYSLVSQNTCSFNSDSLFKNDNNEILSKKGNDVMEIENNKNNNSLLDMKNNLIESDEKDDLKENEEEEGIELNEDYSEEDSGQIMVENEKYNVNNFNQISLNPKKYKFEESKNYMLNGIQNINKILDNPKIYIRGLKKKGEKLNDKYRLNISKELDNNIKLEQRRKDIMKHLRETLKYD